MPVQTVRDISPPVQAPAPPRQPASDAYSQSSTNAATVTAAAAAAPRLADVHNTQTHALLF